MNIKITREEHERLCESTVYSEHLFGSRLFGTHTEDSDYDYIRIYEYEDVFGANKYSLPNIHSFQFDDEENKTQYVWMTYEQFWGNFYSGDGTMQSDVVMFGGDWSKKKALELCRTYKIIKAYCGVAKRDVKLHGNQQKKRFHAERSLYIAESLIKNEIPNVETIQTFNGNTNKDDLYSRSKLLRVVANKMYERKELENYCVPETKDSLLNKMLEANNIREFKY